MYKLILVDDESEVRKGILGKIDFKALGFQVAGEAENGKEALDLIERDVPDVVVTDIRMPIMDGLELSAVLKERYPTVRVIILSGFDEFKYAQQAVKLDIVEYILKPVTSSDMTEMLQKLKLSIDEETAHKEDIKALKEYYIKSMPVMKEKFLISLIQTKMKKNEILDKVNAFNLNLKGRSFAASVISIDANSLKGRDFGDGDYELMKFAVLNIAEEITAKHLNGVSFIHNDLVVVLTCCDGSDPDIAYNRTYNTLEEIRQNIEKYLKFTVTIGLGTGLSDLSLIRDSYKSAVSALDYRFVIGTNRVIYIEDLEKESSEKVEFDEGREQMLKTCIKVGSQEELNSTVDLLFKDLGDMKASFQDCQIYLMEMLAAITKVSRSLQLNTGEIFGLNYNLFTELYRYDTIEEIKEWIKEICLKLMHSISRQRQDTCKAIVEKAKDYVSQNYSDEDLSINKVSKLLHISPSYFTAIFKRETGETFLNFLVRSRLAAALELLSSGNAKTSEVAEKVGYPDPHYFSYFFKKHFGISPKEYKNRMKK